MGRHRIRLPRRVEPTTVRRAEAGATLDCLVLARRSEEWFGVDLASFAFVRVAGSDPPPLPTARSFPVVRLRIAEQAEPPDPARPELVGASPGLDVLGSVSVRRARHLLDQLVAVDRQGAPLLGTRGPSLAYVDLDGTAPSLVLLDAKRAAPELSAEPALVSVYFGGVTQLLPTTDARAEDAVRRAGRRVLRERTLAEELGFRPGYLLVGLDAVREGHVRKAVLAFLPRRARGRATSEAPRRRDPRPSPSRS